MEELKLIPWFGGIVVFLAVLFISYFLWRATKNHLANRYEAGFSWIDKNALAKWIGKYIPFLDEKSVAVSVAKYWDETLVIVFAIYVATYTSLSVLVEDYVFPEAPWFFEPAAARFSSLGFSVENFALVGRGNIVLQLEHFANSEKEFSWWIVKGSAITGGRELLQRWFKEKIDNTNVDYGYLRQDIDLDKLKLWRPRSKSIIIVDETKFESGAIIDVLEIIEQNSSIFKYPVRIVVFEEILNADIEEYRKKSLI